MTSSDPEVAVSAAEILYLLDSVEEKLNEIRRWADRLIAQKEGDGDAGERS